MRGTLQHVQNKHLLCTMYIVQRTMSLQDVLVDYTEYITHTVSTINIYGRIKKIGHQNINTGTTLHLKTIMS